MLVAPRSPRPPAVAFRRSAVGIVAVVSLLLLVGCGGPTVPAIITVNGRVIDDLAPIANANVLVDGNTTTTAADGTFTVTGVHTPYDITLSFPSSTDVWIYKGLTRSDPTVQIIGLSTNFQATVSGSIGTAPYQTGEVGVVFPAGTSLSFGGAGVQSGTTFGPGAIDWGPDDPLHTTLYALRVVRDSSGNPIDYTAFGSLPITLHDKDALTGISIPTQAVSTASLSGSITVPTGYTLNFAKAVVRLGPASAGSLVGVPLANATPSGTFSNTMVPVASGISYGLAATADDGAGDSSAAWSAVTAPSSSATLTLPTPSQPTTPAPNAANVGPGTTFGCTSLAGSIYVFALSPGGATGPHVFIVTDQSSITLPDLSSISRALPSGAGYTFSVATVGPFTSMNAAASAPGLISGYVDLDFVIGGGSGPTGVSGPDQPTWFTKSQSSDFTTAP